ncbi:MAG TPA: GTP-binding protein, partial [bacterium]|nr:GTP-binding protein [bacterium]
MPIIIGTAGHIDHGKSALVKALTGTDPDRLAEEQERGMTIDLGFAFLNPEIAFIDVPGHEKFIKNMVAGASTIDLAILVIAADDGVMPQTREHLDILSLLGVQRGFIVLTKIDLVDADLRQLVREEVQETVQGSFLEGAPLFEVSTVTGEGLPALREALIAAAGHMPVQRSRGSFWLPVDRSFVIKGFGTV